MKISDNGLNLIKKWEGCRLTAYKALKSEQFYTIGWGHYGSDVKWGTTITQEQADNLLKEDLEVYEERVNKYQKIYDFNQNQFDALCSFCYNIGSIDQLVNNGNRTIAEIEAKIPAYCKSNGNFIKGLQNRRKEELRLFCTPCEKVTSQLSIVCPCCGKRFVLKED